MNHQFGDTMSHPLRCLGILAAALVLAAAPAFAAPPAPDAPTVTCMHHLQAIGRALKAYQRANNGHLPAHLSDLYPTYLKDKAMLHCPADPTPGSLGSVVTAKADPNMPVSYLYEMSADPTTYNVPFGPAADGKVTCYEQKTAQRAYFGDRVPLVRCWHHYQPAAAQTAILPAVTVSNRVIRTIPGWEYDPGTVPFLLTSLERDLAAGPDQVHRRWSPSVITGYFAELKPLPSLRTRLDADAAKLAAVPGAFPHAAAGDQAAAVASLHGAAGELDQAIAADAGALKMPGDHNQIAALMAVQAIQAGHPEKGIAALEALQAREPQNANYTRLLAATFWQAGQKEKATAMQARADQQTVGQPAPDFAGKTFTYPLLLHALPAFDSYDVSSVFLPALVLIGPDGKIAARHDGSSPDLEAQLERDTARLLPTTAAAP